MSEPIYEQVGRGPHAVPDASALAGWWKRVGATLIDTTILIVPLAVIFGLLADGLGPLELVILGLLVGVIAGPFYTPLFMIRSGAHNGQTPGKQVVGIRVVTASGEPVRLGTALVRDFVGKTLLGFVPFYTLVDVLFPLFKGDRQAVHDKLASTYVVRA